MTTDHRDIILHTCEQTAKEIRHDVLKMALCTGNTGAHIGGSLSIVEIMAVLYRGIMKHDPAHPLMEKRDRFILSKGHGVLSLYAALQQTGYIPKELLWTFKQNDSPLTGHPSLNQTLGIEFSSGSLGQGLSLGIGVALALKRKQNHTSRVYVLLGDGECNEGSIWEAAAFAAHHTLQNLIVIIDKNGLQYDGKTEDILSMEPFSDKWKSFGWNTITIDGHNIGQLYDALTYQSSKPFVIIAETIKGKGISFIENNPKWHNSRLTQDQYNKAILELGCSL